MVYFSINSHKFHNQKSVWKSKEIFNPRTTDDYRAHHIIFDLSRLMTTRLTMDSERKSAFSGTPVSRAYRCYEPQSTSVHTTVRLSLIKTYSFLRNTWTQLWERSSVKIIFILIFFKINIIEFWYNSILFLIFHNFEFFF